MFGSREYISAPATVFETGVAFYVMDIPWLKRDPKRTYYRRYCKDDGAGTEVFLHIRFNQNAENRRLRLEQLHDQFQKAKTKRDCRAVAQQIQDIAFSKPSTYFVGQEMESGAWEVARKWERLGAIGVLIRKIAAVAHIGKPSTADNERSANNGKDRDTKQQMAGPF